MNDFIEHSSSRYNQSMLKNYRKIKKLGEGNFSDVILIQTQINKKLIALKRIKLKPNENFEILLNEVNLLKSLDHNNIVKCYEYEKETFRFLIGLEYCDQGDLFQKITEAKICNCYFTEKQILNWIVQLFLAIQYLHSRRILHRDIKPHNIFLTNDDCIKLGDFGIAKKLKNSEEFATTKLGTPYYVSPEICLGKNYNFPSDIWMAGIVLYELMNLKKPFESDNLIAVINKIVSDDFEEINLNYSDNLRNLMKKMLEKEFEKRITIEEIMKLPFILDEISKINKRYKINDEDNNDKKTISFEQYLNEKLEINYYSSLNSVQSDFDEDFSKKEVRSSSVSFQLEGVKTEKSNEKKSQFEEYLKKSCEESKIIQENLWENRQKFVISEFE